MNDNKRFAVGTKVRIKNPGISGVVTQLADEPSVVGEYLHKIQIGREVRQELGCNLELIPGPQS